jgi:hypothetical protein
VDVEAETTAGNQIRDTMSFNDAVMIGGRAARIVIPVARALMSGNPVMAGIILDDTLQHVALGKPLHSLAPGIMDMSR